MLRRDPAPVLWACFCTAWLHLPDREADQWWQAVRRSGWSRAIALRSMVLCQAALAHDWRQVLRLYQDTMGPGELVAGLEDLITERVLAPGLGRRIEQH